MVRYLSFSTMRSTFGGGFVGLVLLSLILGGCGSLGAQHTTTSTPISAITVPATFTTNILAPANTTLAVKIVMQSTSQGNLPTFVPDSIVVLPGTTIVWKNMTGEDLTLASHMRNTFTAASKVTRNGMLKMIFTTTEAISYFDKEHPEARGTLLVQPPASMVDIKMIEQMKEKGTYSLSPAGIVIKVGTTVNWSNETDQSHVLMSDKMNVFTGSSAIAKNGSYKVVFSKPGTYNYYSKMFPMIKGVIIVVP